MARVGAAADSVDRTQVRPLCASNPAVGCGLPLVPWRPNGYFDSGYQERFKKKEQRRMQAFL